MRQALHDYNFIFLEMWYIFKSNSQDLQCIYWLISSLLIQIIAYKVSYDYD